MLKDPNVLPLTRALSVHAIWGQLDAAYQEKLVHALRLAQSLAHAVVVAEGQLASQMGWVVSGEVQLVDPDLKLSVQLGVGALFGYGATPARQLSSLQVVALSDCTIAWLQPGDLDGLCKENPALQYFFPSIASQEAGSHAAGGAASATNLLGIPIRSLVKRAPITLSPHASIQETAALMQKMGVSSVMLVENDRLMGLVTDRDLRNRVVAQGLDPKRPVAEVATLNPMTVRANSPAFEALLLMARHNIHHVPVMDGHHLLGMVSATNLTEHHSTSAVYLVGDIYKQTTLAGLAQISGRVKTLQQQLAAADASAYSTGHIITAVTDAFTVRLIQLAETQLGPAPVDYVWVAAGSQARNEQTAKSDQDNCLILDDGFDEQAHGNYFRELSKFVCDGLDACGYIHCPGEMMAMTDTWRQPRNVWAGYFRKWIDSPKPQALMLTCVFFDLRAIHGKTALLEGLRDEVRALTKGKSLFLAHMVSNALKHRPPLGMFGTLSLIKGGDHPDTIDLKHGAIVPIVDLARIYALAAGESRANSHDRLEVSAQAGEVSEDSARDLRGALEFLSKLRIAHQARQMRQGKAPDNYLSLDELSDFERSHLKNAFRVVETLQSVLQQRYAGGRF